MQGRKRFALLAVATMLLVPLWGCGSNRDSDGVQPTTLQGQFGTDANGVVFVGSATCINCHKAISFSVEPVEGFLGSKHVNHSTGINAASAPLCLECHDPIGDGRTLESMIDPANVPAQGLAAVGCENCHGAGGQHFGTGPIPNFSPDFEVCGKCHKDLPDFVSFHPAGLNIIENYKQSAHAESARTTTPCFRCHSDIGFRTYVAGTRGLDEDNLEAALAGASPVGDAPIQCRTCHDQHKTGTLRVLETVVSRDSAGTRFGNDAEGDSILKKAFSSQFNLCTSCHQAFLRYVLDPASGLFTYTLVYDPANPATNDKPFHGSDAGPTTTGGRVIWDTHFRFNDPVTDAVLIPGYNINAADDNACLNCHEAHAANKFAQASAVATANDWAASGHAAYTGAPFTHDFSGEGDRPCMKCHNGTEYARFVNGVPPAGLDSSAGARVIACVACHDLTAKDAAGIPVPGPLRLVADVTFPSGAVQNLGDGSNLCAECHQGRESGLSIVNAQPNTVVQAAVADYPSFDFINRHYFAEAANLFGADVNGGFQYTGKIYQGRFQHFQSTDFFFTCTDCHMDGDAFAGPNPNHNFRPQAAYCSSCHITVVNVVTPSPGPNDFQTIRMNTIDFDGDGNVAEGLYFEIWPNPAVLGDVGLIGRLDQAIKSYAATTLASPVVYDGAVYPYFFKDTNGNGVVDAGENVFANRYRDLDRKLLQAAYNFQVVQKDPCGYIHNAKYLVQLVVDSIEDLGGSIVGLNRP